VKRTSSLWSTGASRIRQLDIASLSTRAVAFRGAPETFTEEFIMTVQLRRSVSALASTCFLGLMLTTATGCGAAAVATPKVPSSADVPAAAIDTSAGDADPAIAAKRLEIAGLDALVDQEKASLAAKDLSADDKAEHQTTLRNLEKMKAGSETELAALQASFAASLPATVEPTQPAAVVAANPSATKLPGKVGLPAAAALPATPALASTLPGSAKLPGATALGSHVPGASALSSAGAIAGIAKDPKAGAMDLAKMGASHVPGGGSALGAVGAVAGMAKDPKAGAMGLAKLGASHIPGGSSALGAATAVAGMAKDPKGAAMELAKMGASHVPGGSSALAAAGAAAALAKDPKGAAADLAKQGATAALNKVPGAGALKGSLFGMK